MEYLCGRSSIGVGYATEHGTNPAYVEAGLCKDICLAPATISIKMRGGDICLCEEHFEEYVVRFPKEFRGCRTVVVCGLAKSETPVRFRSLAPDLRGTQHKARV